MFVFRAKVIAGSGRGHKIGFPTANLNKIELPLDYGIYSVAVNLNKNQYHGLMHYGPKKTFNEPVSCEVFIKNFNRNIYGYLLKITVNKKIREIKKFKNIERLKKQIEKDLSELE